MTNNSYKKLWVLLDTLNNENGLAIPLSPTEFTVQTGLHDGYGFRFRLHPLKKDEIHVSASKGGEAGYDILWREGYLREGLEVEFQLDYASASGRSADLLFALAVVVHSIPSTGKPYPTIAATGKLLDQGRVEAVQGIPKKLKAAFKELPRNSIIFYPSKNQDDIDTELRQQAIAQQIELFPVNRLDEAVEKLGIAINKVYLDTPYRGLEEFHSQHRSIYFGRNAEIKAICAKLLEREKNQTPSVLIVAASGAGKSSLVQAGVIPALQQGQMALQDRPIFSAIWRPSNIKKSPTEQTLVKSLIANWHQQAELIELETHTSSFLELYQELEQILPTQRRFIWVINQMEELFTMGFSTELLNDFALFLQKLQKLGVWLIASLRNDFFTQYQASTGFHKLFGTGAQYDLQALNALALRQVIEEPAKLADITLAVNENNVSLTEYILEDMGGNTDALPLLEFVLKELYQVDKSQGEMTYESYRSLGGLMGAIGQHAEQEIAKLHNKTNLKQSLPNIFHALISINIDNETFTSRSMPENYFLPESEETQIIQTLLEARLLIVSDDNNQVSIRIAHEALITHWQRVNDWLLKDIEFLKWHAKTERDFNLWQQEHRIKARLLQKGKPLSDAEFFLQTRNENIPPPLKSYIQVSIKQIKKKQRISWSVTSFVLLMLLGLSIWAVNKSILAENKHIASEHNNGLFFAEKAKYAEKELRQEKASLFALISLSKIIQGKNPLIDLKVSNIVSNNIQNELGLKIYPTIQFKKDVTKLDKKQGYFRSVEYGSEVLNIAFSPDGKVLASANNNNTLVLSNPANGEALFTVTNCKFPVTDVAFSPDGNIIAYACSDFNVYLWEVANGNLLTTLKGHKGNINSLVFSPNGKVLASTGGWDKTIRLWSVPSGEVLHIYNGHSSYVTSIDFSPNGNSLISADLDKEIYLWDVASGGVLNTFEGITGGVISVMFSPDGRTIAAGCKDSGVRIWDIASGKILKTLEGHTNNVNSVAFSPDGKFLASGGDDLDVRLWSVKSGKIISIMEGHTDRVNSVVFSPDGKTLVSGSKDKSILLWDLTSKDRELKTLVGNETNSYSSSFSPDGKILASGMTDGSIRLWDIPSGKVIALLKGHASKVSSVVFSPDGSTLFSGSYDKTIRSWDVVSGKVLKIYNGHNSKVQTVVISPNETTLASGDGEWGSTQDVRFWDIESGNILNTFNGHTDKVESIVFSPDGKTLASAGNDRKLYLLDVASGKVLKKLEGHKKGINSIAFSPDGKTLASASSGAGDTAIRLWDIRSGKVLMIFEKSISGYTSLAFSHNGKTLAAGDGLNEIHLWDISTKNLFRVIKGYTPYSFVTFSPDGMSLAFWDKKHLSIRLLGMESLDRINNPQHYLKKLSNKWGMKLIGNNIIPIEKTFDDSSLTTIQSNWSKHHPFHWLPKAEHGDGQNMIELGNIYLRDDDISKAKHWFNRAKAVSGFQQIAAERLDTTDKIVEYAKTEL